MKPNPFRKPSAKEEMAEGEAPAKGKKPGFVSKMKTNMGMKKKKPPFFK
jgi:hypothetical protein